MTSSPAISVAIIGGGISGLTCGARLAQLGVAEATVFDTGARGPGGRCSSRVIQIDGTPHVFDHAVQYFTVGDSRFANIVSSLHKDRAVTQWSGVIQRLNVKNRSRVNDEKQKFIGDPSVGLASVARALARKCSNVQNPVWISHVRWHIDLKKWEVDRRGMFDYLVIAHNGKCADRLMSKAGVPAIHDLLRVRFTPKLDSRSQTMQLCSLWVLMIKFKTRMGLPFEGLHVENDDQISWIGNNTAKYKQSHSGECWSILSTSDFASKHKVPQEHIPKDKEKFVTQLLTEAFFRIIGRRADVVFTRLQLWGAANPLNVLESGGAGFSFDSDHQVGIAGDWLISPCLEGAALSGLRLAEAIVNHSIGKSSASVGLNKHFQSAASVDSIGSFPRNPALVFKPS